MQKTFFLIYLISVLVENGHSFSPAVHHPLEVAHFSFADIFQTKTFILMILLKKAHCVMISKYPIAIFSWTVFLIIMTHIWFGCAFKTVILRKTVSYLVQYTKCSFCDLQHCIIIINHIHNANTWRLFCETSFSPDCVMKSIKGCPWCIEAH